MEPEKIAIFALKSDQQRPELVDPGERSLNRGAPFVHVAVEMPLPPAFRRLSTSFVFINVRNHAGIPEQLTCSTRVKTTVGIEVCPLVRQGNALQVREQLFERFGQLIRIVVVARHNIRRRQNIPIAVDQ